MKEYLNKINGVEDFEDEAMFNPIRRKFSKDNK
jgi:hypothetical protein